MLETFLLVVAGVLAALILFVVLIYWYVKRRLRTMFAGLGEAFQQLARAGAMLPPAELKLRKVDAIDWHHPADVARETDALLGLGYVDAGTFLTGQPDQIRLRGFAHPEDHAYALLYDVPDRGVFADIVVAYAGGPWLTYSSGHDTGLDRPPDKPIHRFPGMDAAGLHRKLVEEMPPGDLEPAPPDGLAASVERYYREEMAWRAERGGLTAEEVRRQAAANGQEVDDATVEQIQDMFLARLNEGIEEGLRERFLASFEGSAAQWEAIEDRITFIHNRMPPDMVAQLLRPAVGFDEDDAADAPGPAERQVAALREAVKRSDPRQAFADANAALPPEDRFQKLGELTEPVPADVYLAPVPQHDEEDGDDEA